MKNILCFGDSNTWGCVPGVYSRFPSDKRWTGLLARSLGEDYNVIENGIKGRTAAVDDPHVPFRNGLSSLGYSLLSASPIDLMIVMLGTNDIEYVGAEGYYHGIKVLADQILRANTLLNCTSPIFTEPRLLLVSPIEETPNMPHYEDSLKLAYYTEKAAKELGVPWLDAARFAKPSPVDGCHMDEEGHAALANAIYDAVKKII